MSPKKYYDVLFDEFDATCWSKDPYGTRVVQTATWGLYPEHNFVCINALDPEKDRQPTRPQHSHLLPRRADANIVKYRSVLCEFDKGDINEQKKIIESSGLPYSTLVFSGGKSLHAIISLDTPLAGSEQYKRLVRRIYGKLPGVDRSTGNPSRFTRAPGVRRGDVRQELLHVGPRVSLQSLEAWLGPEKEEENLISGVNVPGVLSDRTNYFLLMGSPEGGWNNALFRAAADMTRAGYDYNRIILMCSGPTGYLDEKDLRTIASAIRTASHESRIQLADESVLSERSVLPKSGNQD